MQEQVKLGNIMIDSFDTLVMQDFYAKLLNWDKCIKFGLNSVESENGVVLCFIEESDFVVPIWPEKQGQQQKQMHLDFQVKDVNYAVELALSLGGKLAEEQFGGEDFVTVFDPSGHPLCLCDCKNQG